MDRGTRLVPRGAPGYRSTRLRAFAGLGDSAEAIALADTLLREQNDPNLTVAAGNVHFGAREFEAHGDTLAAARLRRMTLAWFHGHATPTPSIARQALLGYAWFDLRQYDSAAVYLRAAARDTGNNAVTAAGYLGVIAAATGDTAGALAVADSLSRQTRKWDLGLSTWWRAAIVANLGQRDLALQLLTEARRKGQAMNFWHYHTALRPLRGYRPFEDMIQPRK